MQLFLTTELLPRANSAPLPTATPIDWSQFNDSVLIQINRPTGNKIGNTVCTGVIIHPRVILTTAHCADEALSMTVVYDVENGPSASKKEVVPADQILIHPDYQPKKSLYKADLAILLLKNPAPINEKFIRKIPIHNPLKTGDRLSRLGVGIRNGKNMRNVTDPIFVGIPNKGVYETSDIFSYFGDSGGPLYSSTHELLGVHSTIDNFDGKKTPHSFAVYLPDYQPWIQKSIKGVMSNAQ